jgi:hypothetical protein
MIYTRFIDGERSIRAFRAEQEAYSSFFFFMGTSVYGPTETCSKVHGSMPEQAIYTAALHCLGRNKFQLTCLDPDCQNN